MEGNLRPSSGLPREPITSDVLDIGPRIKPEDKKHSQVVTFGCRLNIYESEIIKSNLTLSGLENAVVFNTCAVTKEAERQAKQAIRHHRKHHPDAKIIVTGCAVQADPDNFANMPEIDKIIGNEEKLHPQYYNLTGERILVNDIMSVRETSEHLVQHFDGKSRAFIQVQNGCDHRCTFCIIPFGRGNSRSVPIGSIVQQVRLLMEQDYREIVLTGVDVTSYGPDLPGGPTFSQMIKRLLYAVPELKRLRLSSIDVAEIDDEMFELMAYEKRLMPHFHISLQAGDNMILKRMKRRHNRDQILEYCHKLRGIRKDVAFGADIIAGFPTETDEMFENTRKIISEAEIQYLHVFPYSSRKGTPAARMPQVEKSIRKERASILRQEGLMQQRLFFEKSIGSKVEVLVEKNNIGHSENFIPVKLVQEAQQGNIITTTLRGLDGEMMV
jgi:threonylcarbamoyladenosine tRNA methylthiotransferase MtaB